MTTALHFVAGVEFNTLPQQLVNGLLLGAIYALIALGYTMVYGVLRLINFAHGEVYMLGAYTALFVSYLLGFKPDEAGPTQSSILNLVIMLLACMIVCSLVGVAIERFAYRPMRSHSRIASLITAIGVSLLLQYGGALFLPNSPPPSISEKVNPFSGQSKAFTLVAPPASLQAAVAELKPAADEAKATYDAWLNSHKDADPFNLPPEGQALKKAHQEADGKLNGAQHKLDSGGVRLIIQTGQAVMLISTVLLMGMLTYLVLFTRAGRAMRAVSHDFVSASLMGVNVNNIVLFTFILGSSLAGAGAMMTATFLGTPLTTFYGLVPGVKAFVAAVLGGIGNIPGAVLGGLLMGIAENLVVWAGFSNYRDAIAFVVLIVVLLFKPGGLMGSSKVEKV
jgi:branched-chain amino acid transport system permease protein